MGMTQGKTQSYYASPRVQAAFEELHGGEFNRSKYLSALVEQRLEDIGAALDLLHKTGWSFADVRGAIGVPYMGAGSLFLSAEATADELLPQMVNNKYVMVGEYTSHSARLLRHHGFPDVLVEQAKQPTIAIALGLLARECELVPDGHAVIERLMAQKWRRPAGVNQAA